MQVGRTIGLAYLSVGGADPVEHIEAAAEAGFGAVGLRILPPGDLPLPHDIVGDPGRQRAIRQACERTGIRVFDLEVFTLAASTDMDALRRALDVGAHIGAAIVQVVVEDPERSRAIERFGHLCDAAAPLGLRVALEFMQWRAVKTIDDANAFLSAAARPNGGLCVDCLHLSRSGGSPSAVASVPVERLHYIQLCDAPARLPAPEELIVEARGRRAYPGDGELWLKELLGVVPPTVPLSIEVPRATDEGLTTRERARNAALALHRFLGASWSGNT